MVDPDEILVLVESIRHVGDSVDIKNVGWRELRQWHIFVDERLGVLVDSVLRDDVGDVACGVPEGLSSEGIVDDDGRANGLPVRNHRIQQRRKVSIAKSLVEEVRLHDVFQCLLGAFIIETPERFAIPL